MPGRLWSEVYMATPLTLSGPSTRGSPAFVFGGRLRIDAIDSPVVALRLFGCKGKSMRDAAPRQLDLKAVLALRQGPAERCFCRLVECFLIEILALQRLAVQNLFCFERTPGLGAHAPQGNADKDQLAAADLGHDGRR